METTVRTRRAAAVCGIIMQLGWLMLIFSAQWDLPDAAVFGISVALCALAAGLVHLAQGPERQRFYAIAILSSGLTWLLLWGLIGLIAGLTMDAPLFETAGVVMGPLAGTVFGCLLALRARAEPGGVPELLVLGTLAGTLIGLAGILEGILDEDSFQNWQGVLIAFVILGALGGIGSVVSFAARRVTLST
jgi:hypothetical protein